MGGSTAGPPSCPVSGLLPLAYPDASACRTGLGMLPEVRTADHEGQAISSCRGQGQQDGADGVELTRTASEGTRHRGDLQVVLSRGRWPDLQGSRWPPGGPEPGPDSSVPRFPAGDSEARQQRAPFLAGGEGEAQSTTPSGGRGSVKGRPGPGRGGLSPGAEGKLSAHSRHGHSWGCSAVSRALTRRYQCPPYCPRVRGPLSSSVSTCS